MTYEVADKDAVKRRIRGLRLQGWSGTTYITDASRTKPDVQYGLQRRRLPTDWDDLVAALAED
jgi:hypothetical protein